MNAKHCLLVLLGFAVSLVTLPGASNADGVEDYCCVCTSCDSGASRQCISVLRVPGFEATDCTIRCATNGCQLHQVAEGVCALNLVACDPAPAPATSRPVVVGLAVLLAGSGFYLVRRRGRAHERLSANVDV
jgi:hypothetical protein